MRIQYIVHIFLANYIIHTYICHCSALTITNGHCQKTISVKYQVPVTRIRLAQDNAKDSLTYTQQYIDYEERTRVDKVVICCLGYRTILFGLCEPICTEPCPPHSYCDEPNKCLCLRGYEPSHHANKEHQLICRPTCTGGCPVHSHCIAPNKCECRTGYKDASIWFDPVRCERVNCAADQRYDVLRKVCAKFDMSVEELMQKVAQKLADSFETTSEHMDIKENNEEC